MKAYGVKFWMPIRTAGGAKEWMKNRRREARGALNFGREPGGMESNRGRGPKGGRTIASRKAKFVKIPAGEEPCPVSPKRLIQCGNPISGYDGFKDQVGDDRSIGLIGQAAA